MALNSRIPIPRGFDDPNADVLSEPTPGFMEHAMGLVAAPRSATLPYQMWKGTNTILKGGWEEGTKIEENTGMLRNFWKQNIKRRSWSRYSDTSIYNHGQSKPGKLATKILSRGADKENAGWLSKKVTSIAEKTGILGTDADGKRVVNQFFEKGMSARIGSYARIMRKGGGVEEAANMRKFIGNVNPAMDRALGGLTEELGAQDMAGLTLMSGNSALGAAVGGFLHGAKEGAVDGVKENVLRAADAFREPGEKMLGETAIKWAGEAAAHTALMDTTLEGGKKLGWMGAQKAIWQYGSREAAEAGVKSAATGAAEEIGTRAAGTMAKDMALGTVARFAPLALDLADIWNPIGWGLLAAHVAKFGVTMADDLVVKPIMKNIKDASVSFKGQIGKSPMGMGYRDNEAAATSRSRGVQAIQNSRINGRSALGAEAGMMHARYG